MALQLKKFEMSEKMKENLISKLIHNQTLTSSERKVLIEALKTHPGTNLKRKLDQVDKNRSRVCNKKLQATSVVKDSVCQTDPVKMPCTSLEESMISEDNVSTEKLKRLWELDEIPYNEVEKLMNKTYNVRRIFICSFRPPVYVVREKYPALFCVQQVKNELDRIFYKGKCADFLKNMNKYAKHILFYESGSGVRDISELLQRARDSAKTDAQKTYTEVVGSIFVLAKLLNENFGFIHLSDNPPADKDVFPYINASLCSLKEIFSYNSIRNHPGCIFHIIAEGEHLCEASNFPEAFLCLMAAFYIFNIDYPDSCRGTLTVIERIFLCGNETMQVDDNTQQWIKLLTMRGNEQD